MRSRKAVLMTVAVLATLGVLGAAGSAQATFPNFSGCTATNFEVEGCIDIQNRSGALNIKGFNVPLGESMEIRGTIRGNGTEIPNFVPPAGTNGFFSRPVSVPGGLLGIEWLPGNSVLAISELAGPASAIKINAATQGITLPIRVRLDNLLLGMDCHIGTNSNPVVLHLITETTSPPPPNRPITGRVGEITFEEGRVRAKFIGNVDVENSFAVPAATECGLGLGLINTLVDLRLQLPSAAGNNSVEIHNDAALGTP